MLHELPNTLLKCERKVNGLLQIYTQGVTLFMDKVLASWLIELDLLTQDLAILMAPKVSLQWISQVSLCR